MAPFAYDDSTWSRLDYTLLRDGGVVLYHADRILAEDIGWLRAERYRIHEFDGGRWTAESTFHADVAEAFAFPAYYGRNLDAFNDCIGDVEVPVDGGLAIVIRRADAVDLRDGQFLPIVLDSLAGTTRWNLLFGRRMLTLLQSHDPTINYPPVGAVPVSWNPREWLAAKRGV